jgi:PKHD-type hydroxylase
VQPWCYWDGAFTADEIDEIVKFGERQTLFQAQVFGRDGQPVVNRDKRISQTAFLSFNDETAWMFERFMGVVNDINGRFYGYALAGFNELQYGVYPGRGANYGWHMDCCMGNRTELEMFERKLSVVMALTDPRDYEGGAFQINTTGEPETIVMPKGKIILFPSFLLHQVTPILQGTRRSLVTWVVGPKFK